MLDDDLLFYALWVHMGKPHTTTMNGGSAHDWGNPTLPSARSHFTAERLRRIKRGWDHSFLIQYSPNVKKPDRFLYRAFQLDA